MRDCFFLWFKSSYYNYGFTNKSKLFSVKVNPFDGAFNRDAFGELFEELTQNKSTYKMVYIDALILISVGQGNLKRVAMCLLPFLSFNQYLLIVDTYD